MGRCDLEQPKISIGTRVVRGKDWKWADQDGNGTGTVTNFSSLRGWVQVKWDHNPKAASNPYRFGLGSYDLYELDESGKAKTEPWKEEAYECAPLHCELQPASAMQTACQGPWTMGKFGPLSIEEQTAAQKELKAVLEKTGWVRPDRGESLKDKTLKWRFGTAPDYTLGDLEYLKYKMCAHAPGSLEIIVENLVKTWEFERSHKVDGANHQTVDPDTFTISANDAKAYNHKDAHEVGNYNVLLQPATPDLWDNEKISSRFSHEIFHNAFPAFAWEVLKVSVGPPEVHFEWRHFGRFTGYYRGNKGEGQLIDLRGHGIAKVNDKLQLCETKIYYDANMFCKVMEGKRPHTDLVSSPAPKAIDNPKTFCPHFK